MYSLVELFKKTNWTKYEAVEDVHYALIREGNTLFIYFEPSKGIDWAFNFMFKRVPYKDMKIPYKAHKGFVNCWKKVEDIIIAAIADETIEEIVIAGYSHGGALAMLCHECCWFHRADIRDNIWGIGFEAPRVYGEKQLNEDLAERWDHFMVIQNSNDIVTHLPPTFFRYTHVGKLICLQPQKKIGLFKAHMPDSVIEALENFTFNENWQEIFSL